MHQPLYYVVERLHSNAVETDSMPCQQAIILEVRPFTAACKFYIIGSTRSQPMQIS